MATAPLSPRTQRAALLGVPSVTTGDEGCASRSLRSWGEARSPRLEVLLRSRFVTTHQRQLLRRRAPSLRHEPTHSESLLWSALRQRQLGVTFRRQCVLQGYIADFYACAAKLVVEVDGAWHDTRARRDESRERTFQSAGYQVLRVTVEDVELRLPFVLARIRAALALS